MGGTFRRPRRTSSPSSQRHHTSARRGALAGEGARRQRFAGPRKMLTDRFPQLLPAASVAPR
eukprot:5772700-Alexandrium_andersonii.AAC.1